MFPVIKYYCISHRSSSLKVTGEEKITWLETIFSSCPCRLGHGAHPLTYVMAAACSRDSRPSAAPRARAEGSGLGSPMPGGGGASGYTKLRHYECPPQCCGGGGAGARTWWAGDANTSPGCGGGPAGNTCARVLPQDWLRGVARKYRYYPQAAAPCATARCTSPGGCDGQVTCAAGCSQLSPMADVNTIHQRSLNFYHKAILYLYTPVRLYLP